MEVSKYPTRPPKVFIAAGDTKQPAIHSRYGMWETDLSSRSDLIRYRYRPKDEPIVVHRSWLRDACTCSTCVDPSSGQKRFASSDVPDEQLIGAMRVSQEGLVSVHWENDFLTKGKAHISEYPFSLWVDGAHTQPHKKRGWPMTPWNRQDLEGAPVHYAHKDFVLDTPEYHKAIRALGRYGIIFIHGRRTYKEKIQHVAARIGRIQDTFYGDIWDVVSKPRAENVAYTSSYLGPHQDLLYMRNVPRIQILYCAKNTCSGGESLFCDGYYAALEFRRQHPELVDVMSSRPVTYHYNKGTNIHEQAHPVLREDGVRWSPPFQKPGQADKMTIDGMLDYRKWVDGAREMQRILEDPENVFEDKMEPGTCVVFDNRRILHGRRAFDTSHGERWLRGTYVDGMSYEGLLESIPPEPTPTSPEDTPSE